MPRMLPQSSLKRKPESLFSRLELEPPDLILHFMSLTGKLNRGVCRFLGAMSRLMHHVGDLMDVSGNIPGGGGLLFGCCGDLIYL